MTKPLKVALYGENFASLLDDELSISATGPECLAALANRLVREGHGDKILTLLRGGSRVGQISVADAATNGTTITTKEQ
jgi:hypothetical protein